MAGMVTLKADTVGLGRFVRGEERATENRMFDLVEHAARFTVEKVKETLSQPGSGRMYQRKGRSHRASAEGQPPAPDTRALRNSIGYTRPRRIFKGYESDVGIGKGAGAIAVAKAVSAGRGDPRIYGPFLEHGGVANNARVAARPWWRPTLERIQADILSAWQRILNR